VELGRLDGLSSTSTSVNGNLPPPSFNLDQLTAMFAAKNLSQTDMIALSGKQIIKYLSCKSPPQLTPYSVHSKKKFTLPCPNPTAVLLVDDHQHLCTCTSSPCALFHVFKVKQSVRDQLPILAIKVTTCSSIVCWAREIRSTVEKKNAFA
jgi:hypothetical protein